MIKVRKEIEAEVEIEIDIYDIEEFLQNATKEESKKTVRYALADNLGDTLKADILFEAFHKYDLKELKQRLEL